MSEQEKSAPKAAKPSKKASLFDYDRSAWDGFAPGELTIPPKLKKEIEEEGLECRFVDSRNLAGARGLDGRGWTPLKVDRAKVKHDLQISVNADGELRRGDLILCIRPKEQGDKERARNKMASQANLQSATNKTGLKPTK
jgi:hypothetical protein